jgi:hypothetical protein
MDENLSDWFQRVDVCAEVLAHGFTLMCTANLFVRCTGTKVSTPRRARGECSHMWAINRVARINYKCIALRFPKSVPRFVCHTVFSMLALTYPLHGQARHLPGVL